MANSIPSRKTGLLVTTVLLALITLQAQAQNGFYKVYPSQNYQHLRDLLVIDNNNYAFITTSFFYRVDGSGNIKTQKELKLGTYSELESVIRNTEGDFWISSIVFDDISSSRRVLFKLSPDGSLINTVSMPDPVVSEYIRLVPSSNNNFFLSYKARGGSGNGAIRVAFLDKNGNKLWEKQSSDTIQYTYSIRSGPNNSADLFYTRIEDRSNQIVSIDPAGNITAQTIHLQDPVDSDYYTSDFSRVNDGFVFAGVVQKPSPLNTDGLVYKTDATGNISWIKKINSKLGDNFFNIAPVTDGLLVIGSSGTTSAGNDTEGDIVLLKLDLSGNLIWTRAFGGARMDYARHLRVLNQHIIFAGQSSYPGQSVSVPALCKTDMNGGLAPALPFQPEPADKMKLLETPAQLFATSLVQSAPGPEGSVISGGNLLDPADDGNYPFVVRNAKNGQHTWYKLLSAYPASMKLFRQVRHNEYIAVTEIKDLFTNWYDVYLLDDNGKIIRQTNLRANNIRDVIATRDGGLLFTGSLDVSFVNYETLLIKLDASLNEQWHRTIGDLKLWETGRRIIETPEQEFLITGSVQTEFDITSSLYVLKIDRDGNKRWTRTFNDGVTTDIGYDVIITPDHNYLFAGSSAKQPFTNRNLLLIKTDRNGNLLWRKTQDLHLMDDGFQLMNSTGGGFLVTGTTGEPQAGPLEKFVFVMKLDDAGNPLGTAYYGKPGLQTMNPCLTATSSGDTVLTGTTQERYGKENLFMVKLDGFALPGDPEEVSIKLFPNPAAGSSRLRIANAFTGDISIAVFDLTGKKITALQRTKSGQILTEDIILPNAATGIYYVNIWMAGKCTTIKWLVVQ